MHRHVIVGLVLAAGCLPPSLADDTEPAPSVDELLDRIERLEQDKTRMQDEIDDLRAQVGDTWLTEERAEEIKELVADVLADADTRASLLQDGMTAGWDGDFYLASSDNRFRLQAGGVLQVRWLWNFHDQPDRYLYGFENTRTKLILQGHMFTPDLTYRVQSDWNRNGGASFLEDAWVRYHLTSDWALRFGQFKVPFNREELVRGWNQQAVERSLVNESLNLGYTQGLELVYADRDRRFDIAVSNGGTDNIGGFGLITGPPPFNAPALVSTTEYAVHARYEHKLAGTWSQFSDFTSPPGEDFGLLLGIAGHYQRNNPGTPAAFRDENTWLAATTDLSVEWGGANLFAAFTYHYLDVSNFNVNVFGVVVQAGNYFTEKFEAFARLEYGTLLIGGDPLFDDLWVLTIGGNYYFEGQDVKLSADIGFGIDPISTAWDADIAGWRVDAAGAQADPQVVIRTQLQLLF